ncbi:Saposin B-type domain-containing protein [Caenorhabditis elegans]|uniref:Saposin B-type domain-containing protein n=1 Tax=Caenorhabditis elegans TaxID=6239 RepID=Q9U391_CAEEL|nr:Saposin B-type domain-containing protein [Caenorhabditis elegans]CAB54288.1 Saposin B-type domain-containing protein [Caenorhabditis elegans]|eukprot:NP_501892.1 Uncharacterized protein CELE_R09E10.8 [Caenorhabditis elegans]
MNLIFPLFFFALLVGSNAQFQQFCNYCGFIEVPKTWPVAQDSLRSACETLGMATTACKGIINSADLNSSYGKMYPYII